MVPFTAVNLWFGERVGLDNFPKYFEFVFHPPVEPIFSAISECQALHPDPEDSDSDFEGDEYDVEEAGE